MSWPEVCSTCENAKQNWRWNLDSVHASIRHLAKEGGTFRKEVEDFVYVSPQRAIRWDLHKFKQYNAKRRKRVLSEETVLSTALRVETGDAIADETGVQVEVFSFGARYAASRFLWKYGRDIRAKAAKSNGVAALVTPHALGTPLNGFGVQHAFFAHDLEHGISQVIFLVAGPQGFDGDDGLQRVERALLGHVPGSDINEIEGLGSGCQVGPLRVFVPPAKDSYTPRANAVLGQLLLCHDGRRLLPMLEDLRAVGPDEYSSWITLMSETLLTFGQSEQEEQEALLQRLELSLSPRRSPQPSLRRTTPTPTPSQTPTGPTPDFTVAVKRTTLLPVPWCVVEPTVVDEGRADDTLISEKGATPSQTPTDPTPEFWVTMW